MMKVAEAVASAAPAPVTSNPPRRSRSGKRKRTHKRKDAPSRPLSAYNIFFREERVNWMRERTEGEASSLKPSAAAADNSEEEGELDAPSSDKNGNMDSMASVLGARWRTLPPEQRKPFIAQAALDQTRYREEMDLYRDKLLRETAIGTAFLDRQNKPPDASADGSEQLETANGTITAVGTLPGGDGASAAAVLAGLHQSGRVERQPSDLAAVRVGLHQSGRAETQSSDIASIDLGRPSISHWLDQRQSTPSQQLSNVMQPAQPFNNPMSQLTATLTFQQRSDLLQQQLLLQSLQQEANPQNELIAAFQRQQQQQESVMQELHFRHLLQQRQRLNQFQQNTELSHQQHAFGQNVLQHGMFGQHRIHEGNSNQLLNAAILQQRQDQERQQQIQNILGVLSSRDQSANAIIGGESSGFESGRFNSVTRGGDEPNNTQNIVRRAIEAVVASSPLSAQILQGQDQQQELDMLLSLQQGRSSETRPPPTEPHPDTQQHFSSPEN